MCVVSWRELSRGVLVVWPPVSIIYSACRLRDVWMHLHGHFWTLRNTLPSFSVSLLCVDLICCGWVWFSVLRLMQFFFKLIFPLMCWNAACYCVLGRLPDPLTGAGPVLWKSWGLAWRHSEGSLWWRLGHAPRGRGVQTARLQLPTQHLQQESVRPREGSDPPQCWLFRTRGIPTGVPNSRRHPQLQQHSGSCSCVLRWLRQKDSKTVKYIGVTRPVIESWPLTLSYETARC